MRINNNFNVLPFYDSLQKQNSKKWYSFGQHYPLICPNNKLLPFQFVTNEELTITGNIVAVNVTTGQTTDLGVKPSVMLGTQPGAQYYIVKLAETAINKSLEGLHYLQINTNKGYIYSEEFVFTDSYSECVRLEYWNEDTLNFTSGEINFDDDFKFVMYISSTIGKPEYEFEEELTKRLGYKFIESQTSNKIYKFNFLAPEYICDAMRLVRMCDYIKLTTKYDTYNALSFSYEPKWQNNGDLAAVDVEFDTDCIIQKLESFNRRLKESFYNALLADIDEPVLFSTDTVAQYYTEFTTTSYINGKLIRQLEAISEEELTESINDIVLPIDNQSDENKEAKKAFLRDIINKFSPKVDLSNYLLKSVWDSVFELRNDIETGKQYIYGKLPVVLQYGLTMYSGDGVDIPSIYEGLPIDNDTIYWKDGILKAKAGTEGSITEITSSMVTSALGYTPYDASNPNGYITSAALANYALSSDVAAVSSKLNDFLEGSDTDNIINKWKELESFLTGLSQSDNLATILGNKAEKTDLAKYIPIAGATDITGEKNFVGGLKVNGSPIYYDTEKKYWKLEGDLLVTGGVTMYGNDSEFVSSTIMDAILYDESTLGINVNGELYVKGGTGGGGISSVTSQMIVDALGYTPASATALSGYLPLSGGTLRGTINIGDSSTTDNLELCIHRNSAKTHIGVSGGESRSYIGNSQPNGDFRAIYIGSNGLVYRDASNVETVIWHGGNFTPSNYLPLSGGTLSSTTGAVLQINTANAAEVGARFLVGMQNKGWVGYHPTSGTNIYNYASKYALGVKDDGSLFYDGGKIWHSGNDGSSSGLDADLLDGYDNGSFFINRNIALNANNINTTLIPGCYHTANYSPISGAYKYGTILNFRGGARQTQFYIPDGAQSYANGGRLFFRDSWNANDSITTAWYEIITSASVGSFNAGSATKLATARTIWGQSFDGTSGINGLLSINEGSNSNSRATINLITVSNNPCDLYLGANNIKKWSITTRHTDQNYALAIYNASIGDYAMWIDNANNRIGLGTITPYQKLHVKGGNITVEEGYLQSYLETDAGKSGGYIKLSGYYAANKEEWAGIIASDYYGANWCTTGGYTHGMIFKSGRSGFDNFVFLDSSSNPIARICSSSFGSIIFKNNVLTDGGITMYSDIRKKTKLKDVVLSLQQVANAPLIEHYYNSDQNKTTHVGSIAQYWAEMNDWFCKKDSEGFYTMEIQNAALASAISIARELVKFESKTDRRIRLLEEENKRLKEEVEYLKLNIA